MHHIIRHIIRHLSKLIKEWVCTKWVKVGVASVAAQPRHRPHRQHQEEAGHHHQHLHLGLLELFTECAWNCAFFSKRGQFSQSSHFLLFCLVFEKHSLFHFVLEFWSVDSAHYHLIRICYRFRWSISLVTLWSRSIWCSGVDGDAVFQRILGWSLGSTHHQATASQPNQNLLTHSDLELASAKVQTNPTAIECHWVL